MQLMIDKIEYVILNVASVATITDTVVHSNHSITTWVIVLSVAFLNIARGINFLRKKV